MSQTKILSSKIAYRGSVITLAEESVRLPDGASRWREVAIFIDSVNVLALDERGRLILTREFRTGLGKTVLKIPGGKKLPKESPRAGAAREFEEETGFKPVGLKLLFTGHGGEAQRWTRHYYYTKKIKPGILQPDADEHISLVRMPLKQAVQLAWHGEFYNGEIAYAILRFAKTMRRL